MYLITDNVTTHVFSLFIYPNISKGSFEIFSVPIQGCSKNIKQYIKKLTLYFFYNH